MICVISLIMHSDQETSHHPDGKPICSQVRRRCTSFPKHGRQDLSIPAPVMRCSIPGCSCSAGHSQSQFWKWVQRRVRPWREGQQQAQLGAAPGGGAVSLDTALRLYGLQRMEVLWERRLDTMALIAWGANRIVVVFRGTNSLKNVLADLEVGGPHAHVWLWLIEPAKVFPN